MAPQCIKKLLIAEFSAAIVAPKSFDPIALGSYLSMVMVEFRCNFI
jgi:hypothetical protein